MAKWNMKPKHYMIITVVSFVIAGIIFSGAILKNDVVGRLIFGFVWVIVGIVWLGQYFHSKNKKREKIRSEIMNKKLPSFIWLIIISLFICLQIYHVIVGNYYDLITSLLVVIILLSMFGVYYLIRKKIAG